ncbi:putative transient receptor potential ion channel protein [Zalerion maritima]|uniref:Transient receptor potential ion channel protein n=1 Tax=Zalerion maritima TaxID=339359 RepID=A0AAD5RX91_9PEZI|nr:putative transient receptor potential ion channel protein [Zalerion maritima]
MAGTRSSNRGILKRVALAAAALSTGVLAEDVLQTTGFSNCDSTAPIKVQKVNISYNNSNKTVTFDIAGTSTAVQNVTAILDVTAYGQQIYSNTFDPCDDATFVDQLCPVPIGTFSASGTQQIPTEFADMVPAIAFQVPDIASIAQLQLMSSESDEAVACVEAEVSNGKTASVPAVSYVAAGVAGAALIMTGVASASAAMAGGGMSLAGGGAAGSGGGAGTISPSFTEVFGWMQGMAMNGMLSVEYPQVYRKFAKNFAFSTGLVPWTQLQVSIDSFRGATGGNLTADSVNTLRNTTLVFSDGSTETPSSSLKIKRAFDHLVVLATRQADGIETSVNSTITDDTSSDDTTEATSSIRKAVSGITAYANELSVPKANTFMTVLLIVSIVIAAIVVGILLGKVILEVWALFASFPKSLAGFRKHYWGSIARAVTSLILVLYGVWVLYCVFQFTQGDSWAAKALAGVSLLLFTCILGFFSWKIYSTARRLKKTEGDTSGLYDDKDVWVKYSLFYESYRKDYWWVFVPTIIYMFAKGCTLAATDGHGMVQTAGQLIVEGVMLVLLVWSRPFERKSGNVINIAIQVVRVLSVCCILIFVEEFGIAQTTQTVTGVVLIAVQSALTGILAILIAWNAINHLCKENPHRKRRKELEKMERRESDALTPLDARNSLLVDRKGSDSTTFSIAAMTEKPTMTVTNDSYESSPDRYLPPHAKNNSASMNPRYRPLTPAAPAGGDPSSDNLVLGAAPIGQSDVPRAQPTIPNFGYGPYSDNSPYNGYQGGYAQGQGYRGY